MPAYVVFTDATLEAIAVRRPATRAELSQISGVGAMKLERYSDQVIALVSGSDVEQALACPPGGARAALLRTRPGNGSRGSGRNSEK